MPCDQNCYHFVNSVTSTDRQISAPFSIPGLLRQFISYIMINTTQNQLAKSLNISFQVVSKWENGTAYPNIEMLPPVKPYRVLDIGCREGRMFIPVRKKSLTMTAAAFLISIVWMPYCS